MSRTEVMKAVLSRWKRSGLSLRAFGKQEGIGYSKLLYWRRKLEGAAGDRSSGSREKTSPSDGAGLVPVRVVARSPHVPREDFEVRLVNGLGLRVPRGFDENELLRLIVVLARC